MSDKKELNSLLKNIFKSDINEDGKFSISADQAIALMLEGYLIVNANYKNSPKIIKFLSLAKRFQKIIKLTGFLDSGDNIIINGITADFSNVSILLSSSLYDFTKSNDGASVIEDEENSKMIIEWN